MVLISSDKRDSPRNLNKFSKPNNLIKIKTTNIVFDQKATTSRGMKFFSSIYHPNHNYTQLSKPLSYMMTKLIHVGILNLLPIHIIDPSKPLPKYLDLNTFYPYHHEPSHDTQKCYGFKNTI